MGLGGVGPSGVSGGAPLRCAGVAKALFAGSPRVGGVAGVSSKLTLDIVCVRLAINEGGLGRVVDIAARGLASSDTKYFQMPKSKPPRASRELGALSGGSDESGTSRE